MKISDARAAVDKEWKKLEKIPAWDVEKVKRRKLFWKHKRSPETEVVLVSFKMAGKKLKMAPITSFFSTTCTWDALTVNAHRIETIIEQKTKNV